MTGMLKWLKNIFSMHKCKNCEWCNIHQGIFTRKKTYTCTHRMIRIPNHTATRLNKCKCWVERQPNIYDVAYGIKK